MSDVTGQGPALSAEALKRRRRRSLAIALTLAALVLLFYLLTIVKLGPNVFNRAI